MIKFISKKEALSADFFIFHSKREAIAHGWQATDPVFPLWAPNCHLEEWQFGSFFPKIPLPSARKPRYKAHFRGLRAENERSVCFSSPHRPTLPRQLPHFIKRNMSRVFTCVAVRLVPTAAHVEIATPIRGRGLP